MHPSRFANQWKRAVSALFVLVVLCAAPTSAQFETAVVLGTVKDGSGAVIPGASITLTNSETGISASALTDENGSYQFLNVRMAPTR